MIQRNPITGEPVIIAPERVRRPNIFRDEDEACPFCAGNERLTPPEIARIGDPWRIRVFPNKYPALEAHEIVVESPNHDDTFDRIPHAAEAVETYVTRYRVLSGEGRHVSIFKNHGPMAGASIPHLHSQILVTPFQPPRVARELEAMASRCALCKLDRWPIQETEHYRWLAPEGSMFGYEQWIVPKRHEPHLDDPAELWTIMQRSVAGMGGITDSFNWMFMNFPAGSPGHWYLQLFPRLAVHAGFELSSGSAINVIEPEDAARFYRQDCG